MASILERAGADLRGLFMPVLLALAVGAEAQEPEVPQEPAESPTAPFSTLLIEYENGGDMAERMGAAETITVLIDLPNDRWAERSENPMAHQLQLFDGAFKYDLDVAEKTGTKRWLSRYLRRTHSRVADAALLADSGAEHAGDEEVAGLLCERWVSKNAYGTTTSWLWNGVELATESKMSGMSVTKRALRVEVDPEFEDTSFAVPEGFTVTEEVQPGFELLRALEEGRAPDRSAATFDRKAFKKAKGKFVYPSVEPFTSSRMWNPLLGETSSELDIDRSVSMIGIQLYSIAKSIAAVAEMFGRVTPDGPSARLAPEVPDTERVWWMLVPAIVRALEPLHSSKAWSDEDLALAREAAAFLALNRHGPDLDLAAKSKSKRKKELELLGRWFRAQLDQPERYSAMVCTVDYGPYVGLSHGARSPLDADATLELAEGLELRIVRISGSDPFALQCVRGEELLWSRLISDAPFRTITKVEFVQGEEPDLLGPYGWKVHLFVTWENGHEYTHLYLDEEANFLFYFMGW